MTNSPVFLDTSGWLAQVNKDEANHREAVQQWTAIGLQRRPFVLTDWIIAEAGNGLAKAQFRPSFLSSLQKLLSSPQIRLIYVTEDLLQKSLELYANRPDKDWGLIDCASFVVMADLGIRDALTADRHFEQAGFRCLIGRPG